MSEELDFEIKNVGIPKEEIEKVENLFDIKCQNLTDYVCLKLKAACQAIDEMRHNETASILGNGLHHSIVSHDTQLSFLHAQNELLKNNLDKAIELCDAQVQLNTKFVMGIAECKKEIEELKNAKP